MVVRRLLLTLFLLLAPLAALAQPGPGGGPPSGWVVSGAEVYLYSPDACVLVPYDVTGGCEGPGTLNAEGIYVSGSAVLTVAGGTMTGPLTTAASTSAAAGLSIPPGTAPASPANGNLWETDTGLFARVNNTTVELTGASSSSFTATPPLAATFPSAGVVNYALDYGASLTTNDGELGINLGNPNVFTALQGVNLNAAALPTPPTGVIFEVGQADGVSSRIGNFAFGATAYYSSLTYGGTNASPSALTSGTEMGGSNFWGYDGSALVGPRAAWRCYADQNWTTSAQGTHCDVATTPDGATAEVDIALFGNDGGITVPITVTGGDKGAGTINAEGLYVNGVAVEIGYGTITLGETATSGFSSGDIIYNNGGVVGQYGLTGTGSVVMSSGPSIVSPTFSGLSLGTCVSAVGLNASNQAILVSCPGAASSIAVDTTEVTNATASNDFLTTGTVSEGTGTLADSGLSSTSTGWTTPAQGTANTSLATAQFVEQSEPGGLINLFRNPAIDVNQRGLPSSGTAYTITTSGAYTADGIFVQPAGASVSAFIDSTHTAGGARQSLAVTGAASVTDVAFKMVIESYIASRAAGKQVTVQFEFYQTSGSSQTPKLGGCYFSSQDVSTTCTADLAASTTLTACATATWCLESYSYAVNSGATNGYQSKIDCGFAVVASETCEITALDFRVTPGVTTGVQTVAPPPELPPINYELPFNQRYYVTSYGNGVAPATATHAGMVNCGNYYGSQTFIYFPVAMRAAPSTPSYWDGAGNASKLSQIAQTTETWSDDESGLLEGPWNINTTGFQVSATPAALSGSPQMFLHYAASAEIAPNTSQ